MILRCAPLGVVVLGATLLEACSLAPKYVAPLPAVPTSWSIRDPNLQASEANLPSLGYRDVFRAPALQRLIAQGLANNQDLKLAAANIAAARVRATLRSALTAVSRAMPSSVRSVASVSQASAISATSVRRTVRAAASVAK